MATPVQHPRLQAWGEGPDAGARSAAYVTLPGTVWRRDGIVHPAPGVSVSGDPSGVYHSALASLARRPNEAVSLSFRLPFCGAHCLSCDRDIHAAQARPSIDDYVSGVVQEMHQVATRIGAGRDVLQLHMGGGRANELSESQLARLVQAVHDNFRLPADAQMSADCDPRRVGWAQLELMRRLGFRRINFSVLDFDTQVQRAIGRMQSPALVQDVCELARASRIETIELEIMVGLPRQTERTWEASLRTLMAMAPDRVTLVRYRHRPGQAPGQAAIDTEHLPDAQQCQALAAQATALLGAEGYRWIGAEQFVLETDELWNALLQGRLRRSAISYTAMPAAAVLGFGVGAVGEIEGHTFRNEPFLPRWRDAVRSGRLPVVGADDETAHRSHQRVEAERLLYGEVLPAAAARSTISDAYRWFALAGAGRPGLPVNGPTPGN